ncbi:MAG: LytTR family DNA-binding domain-containing protein [Bacteroidia bacterium]|nr:LytTR family DNA-binding domain-containing protein [Bacteroidia bacterium]
MTPIRCLIVDDEPLALDLLEGYVNKTPFLQLAGRCTSAIQAMEFLRETPADLLFLDVQMPELSGIAFSRMLSQGPRIIFTTAFEQYALESYKVDAVDYLLKPFNYEEFLRAAQKALNWFELKEKSQQTPAPAPAPEPVPGSIFVKSEYKLVRIVLADVLYVEGLKDYVKIYLRSQDRPVLTLMSLKSLEDRLPQGQFMRVHRSYIVNLDRVHTVERSRILFDRVQIPIAESYRSQFQAFLASRSVE